MASDALAEEAKDGLAAGSSVQLLIAGYPTWLAITELWKHGDHLRGAKLVDESHILIPKDALLGVRFGEVEVE